MAVGSIQAKHSVFQVADAHKPVLSISDCADMGFGCFLGKEGGSQSDRFKGELIPLGRHGSLYMVTM